MTGERYEADQRWNLSPNAQRPLLIHYDLSKAAQTLTRASLQHRRRDLWRYEEVLPVRRWKNVIALGEALAPLPHTIRLGKDSVVWYRKNL